MRKNSSTKSRGQRIKARNNLIEEKQYHTNGVKLWQLERVPRNVRQANKDTQIKVGTQNGS